jgi:hypothetical protein
MMWAQRFWLRLQTLFRRDRSTQRLDDEIQFHLDQQIAENIAGGMSREEARYAAMRTFGNPTFLQEETRDTWGLDLARANCSRHSPRFAAARAKSGLYARGCPLAGFGNRRKHCDLQLHRRLGDQAAALPACGPTRGLSEGYRFPSAITSVQLRICFWISATRRSKLADRLPRRFTARRSCSSKVWSAYSITSGSRTLACRPASSCFSSAPRAMSKLFVQTRSPR